MRNLKKVSETSGVTLELFMDEILAESSSNRLYKASEIEDNKLQLNYSVVLGSKKKSSLDKRKNLGLIVSFKKIPIERSSTGITFISDEVDVSLEDAGKNDEHAVDDSSLSNMSEVRQRAIFFFNYAFYLQTHNPRQANRFIIRILNSAFKKGDFEYCNEILFLAFNRISTLPENIILSLLSITNNAQLNPRAEGGLKNRDKLFQAAEEHLSNKYPERFRKMLIGLNKPVVRMSALIKS